MATSGRPPGDQQGSHANADNNCQEVACDVLANGDALGARGCVAGRKVALAKSAGSGEMGLLHRCVPRSRSNIAVFGDFDTTM